MKEMLKKLAIEVEGDEAIASTVLFTVSTEIENPDSPANIINRLIEEAYGLGYDSGQKQVRSDIKNALNIY